LSAILTRNVGNHHEHTCSAFTRLRLRTVAVLISGISILALLVWGI
jgi:hypothetical protein